MTRRMRRTILRTIVRPVRKGNARKRATQVFRAFVRELERLEARPAEKGAAR